MPTSTRWVSCFGRRWLAPWCRRAGGHTAPGGARTPRSRLDWLTIVDKCLAVKPADRYHDAAALAGDLRRHLSEQPLRGVANRSPGECWRKWRRRRPDALARWIAGFITGAAMIAMLVLAHAFYRQRVREIETSLEVGRKLRNDGRFPEAVTTLGSALEHAGAVPGVGDLKGSLEQQLLMARSARAESHRAP